jgi:hypothetical protein
MNNIIKEGETSLLFPEGEGGGLTGETNLVKYHGQKFVLRKCETISKAKYYEHLSKKFEKFGFFPKLVGRVGKNVLFEYIDGRDLKGKGEKINYIEDIGKILGTINKFNFENKIENLFLKQVKECVSGNYHHSLKVWMARKKRNIRKRPKKVLTKKEAKEILKRFNEFKKKLNPKLVYECTDPLPGNFRVRKNKIYLVDIESIKPRYKGLGISKFLLEWGKTKSKQERFVKGYKSKNKIDFLTEEYKEFINLIFLVQRLNFQAQTEKGTKETYEKIINLIQKR